MARRVATARKGGGAQLRVDKAGWTTAKRNRFLAQFAQTANARQAAASVRMSEQGLYRLKKRDAAFAAAWGEALCEGYAKLEMLMLQRGLAGLDGDRVDPGDGAKAAGLSERTILTLLAQHRQSVRDLREAAARGAGRDAARESDARARLEAKLAEMHERLDGGDG